MDKSSLVSNFAFFYSKFIQDQPWPKILIACYEQTSYKDFVGKVPQKQKFCAHYRS